MKTPLGHVARLKHKPRTVYWDQADRCVMWLEPGRQYLASYLRQLYAPLRAHYARQRIARGQVKPMPLEEWARLLGQQSNCGNGRRG